MPDLGSPANVRQFNGKSVLVKSRRDRRNPPAGLRGTIEVVQPTADSPNEVRLAIEFPQMFKTPAHHRTIVLDHAETKRLLASECNGTFEFEIDDELE